MLEEREAFGSSKSGTESEAEKHGKTKPLVFRWKRGPESDAQSLRGRPRSSNAAISGEMEKRAGGREEPR